MFEVMTLKTFMARRPGCPMVDELGRVIAAWKAEISV